VFALLLRG